jgi:hypothetical protein
MKEIVKVKEKYSVILENYRMNNSVLSYKYRPIIKFCLLCGGTVKYDDYYSHMQSHEIMPPQDLTYQLTLPFRAVNGKINKGLQFVKLLSIVNNKGYSVPFNGLNLANYTKLTDTNDVTVRYSAKQKKFIRTWW